MVIDQTNSASVSAGPPPNLFNMEPAAAYDDELSVYVVNRLDRTVDRYDIESNYEQVEQKSRREPSGDARIEVEATRIEFETT